MGKGKDKGKGKGKQKDMTVYKNQLQEYTTKSGFPLAVYQTVNEGLQHAPKFRASVLVNGIRYTSTETFPRKKDAEQSAAKRALDCIEHKVTKNKTDYDECLFFIHQELTYCKSILNEFAVKKNLGCPEYRTDCTDNQRPVFVSSLLFGGKKYTCERAKSKEEVEQLVARSALQSFLETDSGVLIAIIKSKAKLHSLLNMHKDLRFEISNVHPTIKPGSTSQQEIIDTPPTADPNVGSKRSFDQSNEQKKRRCSQGS